MVRITAFFVAGIIAGIHFPFLASACTMIFIGLLSIYFLALIFLKHHRSLGLCSGVIGLTAVFFCGYLHLVQRTASNQPDHLSHFKGPVDFYSAFVKREETRSGSMHLEVELLKIKSGSTWQLVSGKCLLNIPGATIPFRVGDKILVRGAPQEVPGPGNPGEFDFRRFLSIRNITYRQLADSNEVIKIESSSQSGMMDHARIIRHWAAGKIEEDIKGTRERAIAMALILGDTGMIDPDLQDAYAASGAMHILSVSGLHVGIIYAIILFLLRPLSGYVWSRWMVAGISLTCLWAYALITGMSPSVLRAVMMFSFIAVARPFGRDSNIYNTLAASAFLLLIYDPYLILSVGFQLSYLAVIGIVYLYPMFYRLWEPTSWLVDKLWQSICVSLAAQLATFTLGLYYFHQFPVYFLASNLIVVPLSSLVLLTGVLMLGVSAFPLIPQWVGLLLEWLVGLLNTIVLWIEQLPGSVVEDIQIDAWQCGMMVAAIWMIVLLFDRRRLKFGLLAVIFVAGFTIIQWRRDRQAAETPLLIVYKILGHGALEWMDHGRSWFYADSVLAMENNSIRYHIQPARRLSGVVQTSVNCVDPAIVRTFPGFRYFAFGRATVLWIDRKNSVLPRHLVVDYLILGNNAVRSLDQLTGRITFRKLILDASNSKYISDQLEKEGNLKGFSVHSVSRQGAFIENL